MRIILDKDINAYKKNPKKAIESGIVGEPAADVGADKLYNSKFSNNTYRSKYDAYQAFLIGLKDEPGNPLQEKAIEELFTLVLDTIDYNDFVRLNDMFGLKEDNRDRDKVLKVVKTMKGFHKIIIMYAVLIKKHFGGEEYFVQCQGNKTKALANAVGFDLPKLLKETDAEYAKQRDKLLERFVHNHKRQPVMEKK